MEKWLRSIGLGDRIAAFREQRIAPDQLDELTESDLRELGLTIGERKLFQRALAIRQNSLAEQPAANVIPPAAKAPAVASQGERRPLTLMFIDLAGSTDLGERLDPEDLLEVIGIYRACCGDAVARFGGTVARFVGDGILAYFGHPIAHENDPERAARAALAITGKIASLPSPAGAPLTVRIGIATGRVVVSDIHAGGLEDRQGVTGAVANLAARLQALAEPNGIVVGEHTYPRLSGLFTFAQLEPIRLKGIKDPHQPWRLTGERPREIPSWPAERPPHLTAIHGRTAELDVLRTAWGRAAAGAGQVVLVSGPPGIGKSRLVEHMLDYNLPGDAAVIHMAALPFDENSPLRPLVDHLRAAAGLDPHDDRPTGLAKISGILAGDDAQQQRALPIVAALVGLPAASADAPDLPPDELRKATIAVLIELLLARASEQPLCLVVEDLHWIDPTSRELLDRVVAAIDAAPVMMLLTAREEFTADWTARSNATVVDLEPLTADAVGAMLRDLFGEQPVARGIAGEIAEKTDGVPLFVEEIGRMLLARRTLPAVWNSLVTNLDQGMPASLEESLVARLDRSGSAKDIAQAASVAGRSVRRDMLAIICDTAPSQLDAPLAALVAAGILERHVRMDRETYTFTHALVRDTAYASLLRDRRRNLHERAARALETLDPAGVGRNPEVLALHLTECGAAEAAAPHWLDAARRSLARSSLTEAARMLQRALGALEAMPASENTVALRIQVSAMLGAALSGMRGPNSAETREHYTKAYELCRQSPEDASHFPIYWGWWRLQPSSLERAGVLLQRATRTKTPDHLLQAHHCNWATHINGGLFRQGCEHVREGLAIYETGDYAHHARIYGNHDPKVCAHGLRMQAWWMQGKPKSAMEDEAQALSWAKQLDHVGSRVHALGLSLLHRVYRRDYQVVYDRSAELIAFTSENGIADHGASGMIFRGWVVATQGDPVSGLAMLQEGLSIQNSTATDEDCSVYLCLLAEALIAAGKADEAAERLLAELPVFDSNGFRIWLPELVRVTGEAVLAADRSAVECARGLFNDAESLARQQDVDMIGLRIAASHAQLDLHIGERARAAGRLRAALGSIVEDDGSDDLARAARLLEAAEA